MMENEIENTVLDIPQRENTESSVKPTAKKPSGWKKITMGGVSGIVLGAGATMLSGSARANETIPEEVVEETTGDAGLHDLVDEHVGYATQVNDDMSFSQAFAAARAEVGPGGVFEWHGHLYGTYTADEWEHMSTDDKAEYNSHFVWNNQNEDVVAEVVAEEVESEVEVLGVVYDAENDMNIGAISVDGQEVYFFDVNNDQQLDIVATDLNGDGQFDDNEIGNIEGEGFMVSDLV